MTPDAPRPDEAECEEAEREAAASWALREINRLRAALAERDAEVARLRAAVERVRELHARAPGGNCGRCGVPVPCWTVRALAAAPAPAERENANVGVLDWAIQVCASNGYVTVREPVYKQERQALADAQAEVARLRERCGELAYTNARELIDARNERDQAQAEVARLRAADEQRSVLAAMVIGLAERIARLRAAVARVETAHQGNEQRRALLDLFALAAAPAPAEDEERAACTCDSRADLLPGDGHAAACPLYRAAPAPAREQADPADEDGEHR